MVMDDETDDSVTTNAVLCIVETGRLVVPLLIVDEAFNDATDEVGLFPSLQAEAIVV